MKDSIKLLSIPREKYSDYRYKVIFHCFKWDPQVGDTNTIAEEVVVLSPSTAKNLAQWAERLAAETLLLEEKLLNQPSLYKELGLSNEIRKALSFAKDYSSKNHVRLMRFDFHPTQEGWSISEVNSDVPGGLAEASILPKLAAGLFKGLKPCGDLGKSMGDAFVSHLNPNSRLAFIHATSYSDDRQVMEFLKNHFEDMGFRSVVIGPDHIHWHNGEARCIALDQEGKVDGLIRFFPAEWLPSLPKNSNWSGYFATNLPSCNHPTALLTQSKRLPLVWEKLDVSVPTWQELLPQTLDPRKVNWKKDGWILKPAFGRVGESITIPEVISKKELKKIEWSARLYPNQWVAQQCFKSLPIPSAKGIRHLCIGVFTVNGQAAGFYGRISSYPRIDLKAQDIAILVSEEEEDVHGRNETFNI